MIFITGATGQVGGNIVRYIVENHELGITSPKDIVCLVRNEQKAAPLLALGAQIVKGDLSDPASIRAIFEQFPISIVFHLAAEVFVYSSYEKMHNANVIGTESVLKAFADSSSHTMVYASSIIVYDGKDKKHSKCEHHFDDESHVGSIIKDSDVPYAITKRLAEHAVKEFASRYPEKRFIITRLGPIIGPGDRQIIPSIVKALGMRIPKLIDGGRGILSITSPIDVARAQIFLVNQNMPFSGETFNVAHDHISFRDLFIEAAKYYGVSPPKVSIPTWFFSLILPLLKFLNKLFPKNKIFKTFLSPSALEYIKTSFFYHSSKLESLGFRFQFSAQDAISAALAEFDPHKSMLK